MNYTAYQIQDALEAQDVNPNLAQQIAWAIGDQRLDERQTEDLYRRLGVQGARLPEGEEGKQGGSFITNLGEGVGGTLGALALKRAPIAAGFLGSQLGSIEGQELSGTNFYDRATTPQVIVDMGGSLLGGMAGQALGGGAGRAIGGTLGSALGPVGSIAGAALGGWLLPKLLPNGSKSVVEDDGESGGGWGTLGAVAALPLGYKAARRFAPKYMDPLAKSVKAGAKKIGGQPLDKAYRAYQAGFEPPPVQESRTLWGDTKHMWNSGVYKISKPMRHLQALSTGGEELTYQLAKRLLGREQ